MRVKVRGRPDLVERFGVQWTPTHLVLDADGVERDRIEGFLPADDLVPRLQLALAKLAFEKKHYAEAERRHRAVCERHPRSGSAPEACYWAGVAAYQRDHEARHLAETAEQLARRHPTSEWTRKASVWMPRHESHPAR